MKKNITAKTTECSSCNEYILKDLVFCDEDCRYFYYLDFPSVDDDLW